ncbi:hypothetical protein KDW_39040 [Dictyobacter vulcani]|uniref:Uncharacterized protein n=1 Tax=Dictyobacter vulcani TaxID=2607529 RepID=A0A5J4KRL5_9CHLR|nr:hypothetical protein [Dictyobacter vulcani]GER89742.1 hypothetical protein KDW_39040 [Dictyobacter vulcani]
MANEQHLKKLGEGVRAWNLWREQHPEILPDLRNADLHEKVLTEIDFRHTNTEHILRKQTFNI